MLRRAVNRRRSARSFRRGKARMHPKNVQIMRGGWRL